MKVALFAFFTLVPALSFGQQIYSLPSAGGEVWIDRGRIVGTLQPEPASGGRVWIPHAPNSTQPPYGYGAQPNMLQEQLSPWSGPSYWPDY